MDAEHVGAHVIHPTEEETLQYLGVFCLFFQNRWGQWSFAFKNWSSVRLWTGTKRIPSPLWLWYLPLWPSPFLASQPSCPLRDPPRKISKNDVVNLIPMKIILQNKHISYRQRVVQCNGVLVRHCEISFFQANLNKLWNECNDFCGIFSVWNKWIKLGECHLIFKCMLVCLFF